MKFYFEHQFCILVGAYYYFNSVLSMLTLEENEVLSTNNITSTTKCVCIYEEYRMGVRRESCGIPVFSFRMFGSDGTCRQDHRVLCDNMTVLDKLSSYASRIVHKAVRISLHYTFSRVGVYWLSPAWKATVQILQKPNATTLLHPQV